MTPFAKTPQPPYYAVIFSSLHTGVGEEEYRQAAAQMEQLASAMPGFLGIESTRGADGVGITVSYWTNEETIAGWRQHLEHRVVQDHGKKEWYQHYELRVARVERAYSGPAGR